MVASVLPDFKGLEVLNLEWNGITDDGTWPVRPCTTLSRRKVTTCCRPFAHFEWRFWNRAGMKQLMTSVSASSRIKVLLQFPRCGEASFRAQSDKLA